MVPWKWSNAAANEPDVAASKLDVAASKPDVAASEPDVTASEPDVTTSEPDATTSEPDADADAVTSVSVHSRHCKQRQFPPRTAEMAVAYVRRKEVSSEVRALRQGPHD